MEQQHISHTDIASVPLLWVLPLAIYLLTFILAFAKEKPILYERSSEALFLLLVVVTGLIAYHATFSISSLSALLGLPAIHFFVLFAVGLICHGKIAIDKPSTSHLTEYFLWLSVGGVLGGIFNALIAPLIFDRIWEYPLILLIACLVRPLTKNKENYSYSKDAVFSLVACALFAAYIWLIGNVDSSSFFAAMNEEFSSYKSLKENGITFTKLAYALPIIIFFMICGFSEHRIVRFALLSFVIISVDTIKPYNNRHETIHIERNFFGQVRIVEYPGPQIRAMLHGTTNHGVQYMSPEMSKTPAAYYHPTGPIGQFFKHLPEHLQDVEVGITGLGAGGISCLTNIKQKITYYEIDPAVERLARDTNYFTFLRDCQDEKIEVVLGDARISIEKEPDGKYGVIVIDVFSSDSIPVHLLTKEMMELYFSKLQDDGLIVMHISNRYLDLKLIVAELADAIGATAYRKFDNDTKSANKLASEWVTLTKDPTLLEDLTNNDKSWTKLEAGDKDYL